MAQSAEKKIVNIGYTIFNNAAVNGLLYSINDINGLSNS